MTEELEWAHKIQKSAALLYAKLQQTNTSLAGKIMEAYEEKSMTVPFLQHGKDLFTQAGIAHDIPQSKKGKSQW